MIMLFMCCLLAWASGVGLGLYNFGSHMQPHYDSVTLNTYANLDPSASGGVAVMDAGRIAFKVGTFIDTTKAVAFKNVQTYCAAPATSVTTELLTYDFWAVGVNCCGEKPGDEFRCGAEHAV